MKEKIVRSVIKTMLIMVTKEDSLVTIRILSNTDRADILLNKKAINISVEKGNINDYLTLAECLTMQFPTYDVMLYLTHLNSDKLGRVVFNSQAHQVTHYNCDSL